MIVEQGDHELVEQLSNARYASLSSRAATDAAHGIVDSLISFVEGGEEYRKSRKYERGEKARFALRRTMEGLVGDLLRSYRDVKSGGWVYRSRKSGSFSGGDVSYRNFRAALGAFGNFIETRPGYQQRSNGFDPGGPSLPIRGKAARFRATPLFIDFCSSRGLDVHKINDHFIQDLPKEPLVKRAGSARDPYGTKVRGKPMGFERTGKALELEQQVRELNEFLDRFDLRGGAHRGYVRIFNQGDDPSFNWNKGGRLYSQGDDCYQHLSQDDRLRMLSTASRCARSTSGRAISRSTTRTMEHSWTPNVIRMSYRGFLPKPEGLSSSGSSRRSATTNILTDGRVKLPLITGRRMDMELEGVTR
jgi:hypothetical protein